MTPAITIHVASDHAGLALKDACVTFLRTEGYTVVDHGAHTLDEDDDFPDFISRAAAAVSSNPEGIRGIIFGGSGQGEAMLANRYARVRATVYYGGPLEIITLSREHNDANVLSFGARFVDFVQAKEVLTLWLTTQRLTEEKYTRRNQKIEIITRQSQTL